MAQKVNLELLQRLQERYGEPEIPPCRVCGHEMKFSKIGGGEATVMNCGSPHADWLFGKECHKAREEDPYHRGYSRLGVCEHLKHYRDSEYKIYSHGDSDVMTLVQHVIESFFPSNDQSI